MHVRWGSAGTRKDVNSEKSQRRESILDLHSSVLIIMKFCYCWRLYSAEVKARDADELYSSRSERSAGTSDAWIWILTFERSLQSIFFIQSCPNKQAFRDKLLDPHHGLPVYKESSARLFGLVMKEKFFFLFQL